MSVVILGGNECMERRYKELCQPSVPCCTSKPQSLSDKRRRNFRPAFHKSHKIPLDLPHSVKEGGVSRRLFPYHASRSVSRVLS